MNFKHWLPFIGWREYAEEDIDLIAEVVPFVDATRRYSGFQIEWLGVVRGFGLKDVGPREE